MGYVYIYGFGVYVAVGRDLETRPSFYPGLEWEWSFEQVHFRNTDTIYLSNLNIISLRSKEITAQPQSALEQKQ